MPARPRAFRVEPREVAVQPPGDPPVRAPEEVHRRGYEQQADHGRVEDHADTETEREHLHHDVRGQHERQEDAGHDEGGAGDDARRGGQAGGDGQVVVAEVQPRLADTGQQEDLVVHGESEDDREHHHRHVRLDGHLLGDAEQRSAPAPLEDRDHHTVGSRDGEQVQYGGLERDERAAEDGEQEYEGGGHDHADDQRQFGEEGVGEGLARDGGAGDEAGRAGAGERGGHGLVPERVDQVGGGPVLRAGGRGEGGDQHGVVGAGLRGRHRRDARHGRQVVSQRAGEGPAPGLVADLLAVELSDDRDRAVGAGAEALADEVVGPAVGAGGGLRARVDVAQVHRGDRYGEEPEQEQARGEEEPRLAGDPRCPTVPDVVGAGGFGDRRADMEAVDSVAEQSQQRGGERDRGGRRDDDGQPRRDAERADEAHARDVQAAQCHGHGRGGDQDGAPAGGHGAADRVGGFQAVTEERAVAG